MIVTLFDDVRIVGFSVTGFLDSSLIFHYFGLAFFHPIKDVMGFYPADNFLIARLAGRSGTFSFWPHHF
jgi:hypothetical protein